MWGQTSEVGFAGDGGAGDWFAAFVDHLSFEGEGLAHAQEGTEQGQEEECSHLFFVLEVRELVHEFTGSPVHELGFTGSGVYKQKAGDSPAGRYGLTHPTLATT